MANYAHNKQALFNYELIEQFEAGIVLQGWEVKSIRSGWMSLKESYVALINGKLTLVGSHITGWPGVKLTTEDMARNRELLLNKSELNKIRSNLSVKGNTAVAIDVYPAGSKIKVKVAIARGKKLHDKRQKLKEMDQKRSIERDLKHYGMLK